MLSLALVAAMDGCDSGAPSTEPSVCAVPTSPPAGVYALAGQAPGGGGLEVVDHGFTQFSDSVGAGAVSLGALVRNTSDRVAYRTGVQLRIKDAQGRDAVDPVNARGLILEIPVIRPGEQVALGIKVGTRYDVSLNGASDKVTAFEVELGSATWLPAGEAVLFPTFVATFRGIDRDRPKSVSGSVRVSVSSTSCRQMMPRGTTVVFFDSSGHVVGGDIDSIGDLRYCGTMSYDSKLLETSVPASADEGKTLVSEYCDLARPEGGVYRPSGAPFN